MFYEDVAKEEITVAQEHATITPWWAVGLLLVSTVLVAICAEFLVDSIDGMVEGSGISETFVGLILLPIVGNAAEVSTTLKTTKPCSYANGCSMLLQLQWLSKIRWI